MKKALCLYFGAFALLGMEANAKKEVRSGLPTVSEEETEAKKLYLEGKKLFDENSEKKDPVIYQKACKLFERAYVVKASPLLLFNVAVCSEKLADWHKALRAYEAALAHEPPPDDETMIEIGKALPRVRRLASISEPRPLPNSNPVEEPRPVPEKPVKLQVLQKPDPNRIIPVPFTQTHLDAHAYFRAHKKSLIAGGASIALAITAASLVSVGLNRRANISSRYDACRRACDLQAEANAAGQLTWAGIGIGIGAVLAAGTSIAFGVLERRQLRLQAPTLSITPTEGSVSVGFTF